MSDAIHIAPSVASARELFNAASALMREIGERFPADSEIAAEATALLNAFDEAEAALHETYNSIFLDTWFPEET